MDVGHPAGATPPVRRESLVELAGYVGAASAVAGTVTVFSRNSDLSDGASLAVLLVVAAVLVIAGFAIGDCSPDTYERMRSVLWFVAAVIVRVRLRDLLVEHRRSRPQDRGDARWFDRCGLLVGALADAAALAPADRVLLHGGRDVHGARGAERFGVTIRPERTAARDLGFRHGVVHRRNRGISRPPRTARVLGAAVSLLATLEMFGPSFWLALTLLSVTSLVLLAVGDRKDDRAVSGLGIVGDRPHPRWEWDGRPWTPTPLPWRRS